MLPWPTLLTSLRMITIPLIAGIYLWSGHHMHWVSGGLFVLAGLTDALDGYLARRLHQETSFGAFLDPVADKLIVSTVLVILVHKYASLLVAIAAMIIIGREIAVSALREWMAEMGQHMRVNVHRLAKIKTTFQLAALAVLLTLPDASNQAWYHAGLVLLGVAVLLTLSSMLIYLRRALPVFKGSMSKMS